MYNNLYRVNVIAIIFTITFDSAVNNINTIFSLVEADIDVAAILISMGAVLGRTTFIQLIIMGLIEMVLYQANYYLKTEVFHIVDFGDSISIHVFGAYFGLAVSFILNMRTKYKPDPEDMESSYVSDTFAMIGEINRLCFKLSIFQPN